MAAALKPNLSVSQNFFTRPRLAAELVAGSGLGEDDFVYEIGPGLGIFTAPLAQCCRQVVAVELDAGLAARLRQQFAGQANLRIQQGDFLEVPLPRWPYKVFANLPFNQTAAMVSRLTEAPNPPEEAFLVMQAEAAETLLGRPRECLRSVLLKAGFALAVTHRFRREDFSPRPQVEAVLLHLHKLCPPWVPAEDRQRFRNLVVCGFTAGQATLGGNLRPLLSHRQQQRMHAELGIDFEVPPSALSFTGWLRLFAGFEAVASVAALQRLAGSERRLKGQQRRLEKVHRTRR